MPTIPATMSAFPAIRARQGRFLFSILTALLTIVLLSWGAVVTSINAGLAVPDWPSSFDSYDPFAPLPGWTRIPAVLAEHGHRLMGALVGGCTLVLTIWTLIADPRRWMKGLAVLALVLVSVQGTLGGLRVVWVSIKLAAVHACVAQIFFAILVAMTIFVSRSWNAHAVSAAQVANMAETRRWSLITAGVIFVQFILGALLRHLGMGVDLAYAALHVVWGMVVLACIGKTFLTVRLRLWDDGPLNTTAKVLAGMVLLQLVLGFLAYAVLMNEQGLPQSLVQVWLNSSHLVVGALVMAATVAIYAFTLRNPQRNEAPA